MLFDETYLKESESADSNIPLMQGNDKIVPLEKLDGKSEDSIRVIVLVYTSVEIVNKGKYLKIIGIDVYTGTTVLIVDTNSMKLGLHSYQDYFVKLKPYSVIKAPFKYVESDEYFNVLRITGIFELLGNSKIEPLKEKYDLLGYTSFVKPFDEIDKYYADDINNKKKLHIIVRFSGTQLIPHNNKEQLKMGAHFANIHEDLDVSTYSGYWYIGLALLTCRKNQKGSYNITILELNGEFYDEDEYNCKKNMRKIKKESKTQTYTLSLNDGLYNSDENEKELEEELRYHSRLRRYELFDENDKYYNSDYILDGCDDDYFSEWEEEYPEYMNDGDEKYRKFDEPIDDYADEYDNEELEKEMYLDMLRDMNTDLSEIELQELLAKNYEKEEDKEYQEVIEEEFIQPISLDYITSSEKYEIESILNDKFSINFNKVLRANESSTTLKYYYNEADIEDIPF